ncbi:MAG: hypothetical protein ACTSWL_01385, partial [Promethearchaeota archaeon]
DYWENILDAIKPYGSKLKFECEDCIFKHHNCFTETTQICKEVKDIYSEIKKIIKKYDFDEKQEHPKCVFCGKRATEASGMIGEFTPVFTPFIDLCENCHDAFKKYARENVDEEGNKDPELVQAEFLESCFRKICNYQINEKGNSFHLSNSVEFIKDLRILGDDVFNIKNRLELEYYNDHCKFARFPSKRREKKKNLCQTKII